MRRAGPLLTISNTAGGQINVHTLFEDMQLFGGQNLLRGGAGGFEDQLEMIMAAAGGRGLVRGGAPGAPAAP